MKMDMQRKRDQNENSTNFVEEVIEIGHFTRKCVSNEPTKRKQVQTTVCKQTIQESICMILYVSFFKKLEAFCKTGPKVILEIRKMKHPQNGQCVKEWPFKKQPESH